MLRKVKWSYAIKDECLTAQGKQYWLRCKIDMQNIKFFKGGMEKVGLTQDGKGRLHGGDVIRPRP